MATAGRWNTRPTRSSIVGNRPEGRESGGKLDTLLLIDGNNIWWRSFHALRKRMDDGRPPTWAVHGAVMATAAVVKKYPPSHVVMALDDGPSEYRRAIWPEYKAGRATKPEDEDISAARIEFDRFRRLLGLMGMFCWSERGVEADDVIAELARGYRDEAKSVLICTGDKDLRQLCAENVSVLEPSHAYGSEPRVWTPEAVLEHYGVEPMFLPDLLALAGDSSDGIPGVRGIGPKKAAKLVNEYGAAEVAAALDDKLSEHRDEVRIAMQLIQLPVGLAKCGFEPDEMRWDPLLPGDAQAVAVDATLNEMELERVRELWILGTALEGRIRPSGGSWRTR